MKITKHFLTILAGLLACGLLFGQDGPEYPVSELQIQRLPTNIEEFVRLRDSLAASPEGGAAIFVTALAMYTENQELGLQALTVALDSSQLSSNPRGYQGFAPSSSYQFYLDQLKNAPHIARSYFVGTSFEDSYRLPNSGPLSIKLVRNPYSVMSETEIRVFVYSSGADTARPITLKKNNRGIWKAYSSNSLFVGVRPPAAIVDDTL